MSKRSFIASYTQRLIDDSKGKFASGRYPAQLLDSSLEEAEKNEEGGPRSYTSQEEAGTESLGGSRVEKGKKRVGLKREQQRNMFISTYRKDDDDCGQNMKSLPAFESE
ncbi:hypothetical protein STEG23_030085, partial [Scotinomys teguina]